jgi:undecaprenyl-diphosphatase
MSPAKHLGHLASWVGRHELATVIAFLVLTASTWIFGEVADEIGEGSTLSFDRALLLALRSSADPTDPIGPHWMEELARDITALGGITVMSLLTIAVVGYLRIARRPHAAAFVGLSVLGAVILTPVLKRIFERPRPDVVSHLAGAFTGSFPSGHAILSTSVYLTLGVLLARLHKSTRIKAYVLFWAVGLAVLVGVSRVYVGVHWPTDVLGGWAAGAAWAALTWILARALQRRGSVEQPVDVAIQ